MKERLTLEDFEKYLRREITFVLGLAQKFSFDEKLFNLFEGQFYTYMQLLIMITDDELLYNENYSEYNGDVILAPISHFLGEVHE